MFNFLKRLFRLNINTPPTNPPATPKGRVEKTTANKGKKVEQVAFDQAIELINLRLDISHFLTSALLFALIICFIALFFGYWQFASTSFNDYSQKVKELNDQRYQMLENRVKQMENKNMASQSAK